MSLLRLNPTLRALTRAVTRPSAPFVTRSILNRAGISSANVIGRHYASNPKPKSCHAKIKVGIRTVMEKVLFKDGQTLRVNILAINSILLRFGKLMQ